MCREQTIQGKGVYRELLNSSCPQQTSGNEEKEDAKSDPQLGNLQVKTWSRAWGRMGVEVEVGVEHTLKSQH